MENQVNIGDQNTPPVDQNPVVQSTVLDKPKANLFIIVMVAVVCSLIFGFGGYYLGRQSSGVIRSEMQDITPTTLPSPVVYQTNMPSGWKSYSIPQLGLNFDLPPKMVALGAWFTEILPGDTGNNICFHLNEEQSWLVKSIHAGGVGICSGKYFTINSVSSDFTAGRGGSFSDISGYRKKDGQYYLGLHNSESERPLTTNQPEEITTSNGLKYLLITGEDVDNPGQLLPSEYIGALINTNNVDYPGVVVTMKLESGFDKALLDSIISTFKFGN